MTEVELKAQRCALPGCDELIERADGQKARKYCCAAHRVISRQQRREAEEQNAYQALVAQSPVVTAAPQSAATPAATRVVDLDPADATDEPLDAEPVEPEAAIRRPNRKVRRTGRAAARRTAALPAATTESDDETAEDAYESVPLLVDLAAMDDPPDRPADHPAMDDGWDAVGSGRFTHTTLPPSTARAKRRTGPGPDTAWRTITSPDGESREKGRKRRTQAIALLGAASILAGGGGWVVSNANAAKDPRADVGTPGQPTLTSPQEWLRQAKVSLVSVSRQLDIVAQVEELWKRSPGAQNSGALPAAVQAMLDRKAALEQQRATLQSWLAAVESVDAVTTQLAQADAQLASIDRALASPTSGPETVQVTQLRAQRDFVKQQRDAKAAELASLKNTVNQVAAQPLPDPASEQTTEELGQRVTNLANDPNAPDPGHENGRLVPMPAIAYRNNEGETNQDPGTGAPPRPGRGSLDGYQPDSPGHDGAGGSRGVGDGIDGFGTGASDGQTGRQTGGPTINPTGDSGAKTLTAATDPGPAAPQAAPVGRGPNGEVLTTEQQIRYDALQKRRAINDAKLLATRAADRKAALSKPSKTSAAEKKNLIPLQRQKTDIARAAEKERLRSVYSERDKLTLAQRDVKREKLDADPNASFRTGTPKPTAVPAFKQQKAPTTAAPAPTTTRNT